MIYLSGAVRTELAFEPNVGFIVTPDMGNLLPPNTRYWAADTGCFAQGDKFDLDRYLDWLDEQQRANCLFATAPDVVGNAGETWARSRGVLPILREMGFKAALVAQDGIELPTAERPYWRPFDWEVCDAVFIGGTTEWKLGPTAREVARKAKQEGKWLHMGRVNSEFRLHTAELMGCDSVDGTFLAFGPDANLPRLRRWLSRPFLPMRDNPPTDDLAAGVA